MSSGIVSNQFEMICHKKKIGKYYIYNNENISTEINKNNKISNKLEYIRQNWINYKNNCDIVKLLFNQQAYEYYRHHLKNKFFKLTNIIDNIASNPYIDINYTLHDNNIFGMICIF